jgi:hypothetical protein
MLLQRIVNVPPTASAGTRTAQQRQIDCLPVRCRDFGPVWLAGVPVPLRPESTRL